MKLRTFKQGGIHPPENKTSAITPIKRLGLPQKVSILLSQHLGAPALPVIEVGNRVKVGTLIAKRDAFISAKIHSSVSGTILKIDEIMDASGYKKNAVVIEVQGDEWEDSIDTSHDLIEDVNMDPESILEKINEMGVVGLGGATFPTHIKYMVSEEKKADTLLINGVECEPYLTADHGLMIERADEIMVGIQIMMKAGKVDRAIIGIEANKPDAIEIMQNKAKGYPGVDVVPLKVKYPQGAEKMFIKAVLNREVPSGRLPLDVGCIVNNIGTAFAIYEAVQKNKPLIERVVTITGKKIKKPGNFLTRIGVPASMLLEALEEEMPENTSKIIIGGSMMGKAVSSLDTPITKGTAGIVLIDETEARRRKVDNCIRCTRCINVCSMGLEPYLLEKLAFKGDFDGCEAKAIVDCIECGACSYICPSSRPILDYIRYGKANVMRLIRERRGK